jgi:hypothetical protein
MRNQWVEYLDFDTEGEDIDISSFDDAPVVVGTINAFDPWADVPTDTYTVPPDLLARCRNG